MTRTSNEVELRGKAVVSVLSFLGRMKGGTWRRVQNCVGEGEAKRGQTVLVGIHFEKVLLSRCGRARH